MRSEKVGDSRCDYPRDVYPLRRPLEPSPVMAAATEEMLPDERMVREFLVKCRPPAGKVGWTEADVTRMLRELRNGHRR